MPTYEEAYNADTAKAKAARAKYGSLEKFTAAAKAYNTKQAAKKDVANDQKTATHGAGSTGHAGGLRSADEKSYHISGQSQKVSQTKNPKTGKYKAYVMDGNNKVQPLDPVNLSSKPNMNLRKDPTMTPNNERISSMITSTNIGGKHTPSKGAQGGAGAPKTFDATLSADGRSYTPNDPKYSSAASRKGMVPKLSKPEKESAGQRLMREEGEYDVKERARLKEEKAFKVKGMSDKEGRQAKRAGEITGKENRARKAGNKKINKENKAIAKKDKFDASAKGVASRALGVGTKNPDGSTKEVKKSAVRKKTREVRTKRRKIKNQNY